MSSVSRAVSGVKISHSPKSWSETSTVRSSSVSPPKSHGAARRLGFKGFSSVKSLPFSLMPSTVRAGVYHAAPRPAFSSSRLGFGYIEPDLQPFKASG